MPGRRVLEHVEGVEVSVDIGRIGIWTFHFEQQPWTAVAEAADEPLENRIPEPLRLIAQRVVEEALGGLRERVPPLP